MNHIHHQKYTETKCVLHVLCFFLLQIVMMYKSSCCVLLRSSFSRLLVDCLWGEKLVELIDMSPFEITKPICDTKMTRFPSYSGAGIINYQTMRFYMNIANDLERPQIPFICLFGFFHLFFPTQVLD